jgi:hypothetical protein
MKDQNPVHLMIQEPLIPLSLTLENIVAMLDATAEETTETMMETSDLDGHTAEKSASPKSKSKPAKAKPAATAGPLYLLLQENGRYKELRESELPTEAAVIFKDPTLRLVKAQHLIPELSFKLAEE